MEKNAGGKEERPRVGVGVIILNEQGEVLLGLRAGSHGAGEWAIPGGHLEIGETIFETATREVLEETGLAVDPVELVAVCDDIDHVQTGGRQYVHIGVLGRYQGGEPAVMEPHKCTELRWFPLDALPEPLFHPTLLVLRNYQDKKVYQPQK